jgi:hypothetical protein
MLVALFGSIIMFLPHYLSNPYQYDGKDTSSKQGFPDSLGVDAFENSPQLVSSYFPRQFQTYANLETGLKKWSRTSPVLRKS